MSVKNVLSAHRFKLTATTVAICLALAGFAVAQFAPEAKPAPAEPGTPPAEPPAKFAENQPLFSGGLPRLEQFLSVGLDRHPDVVIARSKVEAARAELLKAEAVALKELMLLHQRAQSKRAVIDLARRQNPTALGPTGKLQSEASELSMLEWEIAQGMGFQSSSKLSATQTTPAPQGEAKADVEDDSKTFVNIAYPKGAVATKVKTALAVEMNIDLPEAALADVCELISEKAGIQIVVDETTLNDQGFDLDAKHLKLKAKSISVASLLQQIEDRYGPLHFVVRDYGILVTAEGIGQFDSVSVRDFANLTEQEIRDKHRAKQKAQARMFQGGMGGMGGFGGGMGGMGGGGGGMGGGGGGFF